MPRATIVERIAVDPASLFYREHLARYEFSAEQIRPGRTLDIACGTGAPRPAGRDPPVPREGRRPTWCISSHLLVTNRSGRVEDPREPC